MSGILGQRSFNLIKIQFKIVFEGGKKMLFSLISRPYKQTNNNKQQQKQQQQQQI